MLYQQSYPITNKLLNASAAGSTSTASIIDGGCTLSKPGSGKQNQQLRYLRLTNFLLPFHCQMNSNHQPTIPTKQQQQQQHLLITTIWDHQLNIVYQHHHHIQ